MIKFTQIHDKNFPPDTPYIPLTCPLKIFNLKLNIITRQIICQVTILIIEN